MHCDSVNLKPQVGSAVAGRNDSRQRLHRRNAHYEERIVVSFAVHRRNHSDTGEASQESAHVLDAVFGAHFHYLRTKALKSGTMWNSIIPEQTGGRISVYGLPKCRIRDK